MAYLLDEDQKDQPQVQNQANQQPLLGGGGGGFLGSGPSAGTGGGSAQAPKQGGAQQQGSGRQGGLFQGFYDARDKNFGTNLQQQGSTLVGNEKKKFDAAADPLRKADYKAVSLSSQDVGNALGYNADGPQGWSGYSGSGYIPDPSDATAPPATNFDTLKNALTQDYKGPMSVDYKAGDDFYNAEKLGNRDQYLDVLSQKAQDGGAQYGLGSGNRRLDMALGDADQSIVNALGSNAKTSGDFKNAASTESDALAAKAQGFKDAAAQARDANRGTVQSFGKDLLSGLQAKADSLNAAEKARRAEWLHNKKLSHTDDFGNETPGGAHESGDYSKYAASSYTMNGDATAGNVMTAQDDSAFNQLASLLGEDPLAKQDKKQYQQGRVDFAPPPLTPEQMTPQQRQQTIANMEWRAHHPEEAARMDQSAKDNGKQPLSDEEWSHILGLS